MHNHNDRVFVCDSLFHKTTWFGLQALKTQFQHRFLRMIRGARLSPYKYLFIFHTTPGFWYSAGGVTKKCYSNTA